MTESNGPIDLERLYAEREAPASLRDAVRGRVFSDASWSRRSASLTILRAVAALSLFVAGYVLGGRTSPAPIGAPDTWVLFTYGASSRGPALEEERVAAMASWIRERRASDPSTTGDKLAHARYVLGTPDPGAEGGERLSGLFRFAAADEDAARRVARNHPHVQWGGRAELRRIEP